ncbi:hypothetical protein PPYR_04295 [Photinus pyralis]|uniref:Palmitoyltransferase n=3 Tax=Photinus pyralis TaxID=7054 RepID=A0A5N4AXP2_PHOPY|nr:hypothetical protein PPYR_04295 [Photinus pyralis]
MDSSGLCCCEYIDLNQGRNHILACCCNCEDLDESVDKLLMGQTVSSSLRQNFLLTLEDRLRIPWPGGARKIRPGLLLALTLIPGSILIATINAYWTFTAFTSLYLLLFYLSKSLQKANFFVDCVIVTIITIFLIFEYYVVPFLEILIHENVIFFLLYVACIGCMLLAVKRSRQLKGRIDSSVRYCSMCEATVPLKSRHFVWIGTCVGEHNRVVYLLSQLLGILSLMYSANLTLTTICHPFRVYKTILLPDDCSEVYVQFEFALSFVNAVFSLSISALLLLNVLYELLRTLVCKRR